MADRGGVRSSARLNGDGAAASNGSRGAGSGNGRSTGAPPSRGRPLSSTGAAAQRRARAAERAAEVEDSPRVLRDKCRRLARALRNAKHLVVYTGAGISTAADIPDYRGPRGVWTRLRRGESVARVEVARAQPTFTHMALTALWARGTLKFVVSQNCDGLHLRAGLPRRALAELHGDMFAELCAPCRAVYLRAFDTTPRTARHRHGTRRLCHACGAELRDSIVHFGERGRAAWPLNWAGALRHAARADVVLCLGSSLKVLRRYPRLWRMQAAPRARPALYIVNLQWTPKDAVAALKINARCDAVMRLVARRLRLRVPRYRAERDPVLAHAEPLAEPEAHTSRRPALAPPPPPAGEPDAWDPSSPSASDSDEELPLRCLAERLRASPPRPLHSASSRTCSPDPRERSPCHRASSPDPGTCSPDPGACSPDPGACSPDPGACSPDPGACSPDPGACSPDPRAWSSARSPETSEADDSVDPDDFKEYKLSPDSIAHCSTAPDRPYDSVSTDQLHAFQVNLQSGEATILLRAEHAAPRGVRRLAPVQTLNGHAANGGLGSRLRRLLEYEPRIDAPDDAKVKLEEEVKAEVKEEGSAEELAAAIIRRAVLLCRASLYPGLHTIVAPAPRCAPRCAAACAWCARQFGAARCLWYGPPRLTPLAARAWRRVRARRYLCACCGAEPDAAPDDGGWYGKGYRKGRRRRR